jgi:hypothetical protein
MLVFGRYSYFDQLTASDDPLSAAWLLDDPVEDHSTCGKEYEQG